LNTRRVGWTRQNFPSSEECVGATASWPSSNTQAFQYKALLVQPLQSKQRSQRRVDEAVNMVAVLFRR
jgi:hypothetical protein